MALTKIPRGLLDTGITDSSDATAITIDSSENVTFAGNIAHASNFTIDVGGDITLDADGGDINFHDGGTLFGQISNSSGLYLVSNVSDADIFIRGNDGGSMVNALTFDMSAAGAATFNSGVTLSGDLSISYQGGNIIWGTNYPAIGNIKSSQATLLGNNIKAGSANNTIVRHANGTDAGTFIGLTYNKGVTFHTGITTTQNSDAAETTNERMRIDPTGIVLIGGVTNTAGGYKFKIGGSDNQGEIALFSNATASDLLSYDRTNSHYLTLNIHASPTIFTQGYVGIGETSPDNKLHITGANWNNAHIKIERTDNGSANDPGIVFKSAAGANEGYGLGSMWFQNALDGNAYAMIRARTDDASGTSGKLEFVTSTSAVGNGTTPALTIDSAGYVSMPQQPRMIRSRSAAGNQTIANGTAVNVDWNGNESTIGINYTSSGNSTGEFSVVEAGVYLINAYARFQTTSTGFNSFLSLHHKSTGSFSEIAYDYVASSRSYQQMNISRSKVCAAGDTFRVQIWHNQGGDLPMTGNGSSAAISVIKVA